MEDPPERDGSEPQLHDHEPSPPQVPTPPSLDMLGSLDESDGDDDDSASALQAHSAAGDSLHAPQAPAPRASRGPGPAAPRAGTHHVSTQQAHGDIHADEEPADKEGWMTKEGRVIHNWKRRWFVLRGSTLAYFVHATGDKAPKGTIELDGCTVRPCVRKDIPCMELSTDTRRLYFTADDPEDSRAWVVALNNKIAQKQYMKDMAAAKMRPDSRVLHFFRNSQLTSMAFDGRPLHHEEVAAISQPIGYHSRLRTLSIQRASLSAEHLPSLVRALAQNTSIEELCLQGNRIGAESARMLAQALTENQQLRSLALDDNPLGDDGVAALATCLPAHRALDRLSLAGVGMTDRGVHALCAGICHNFEQICSLMLSGFMENADAEKQCCYSLPVLVLSRNRIGDEGAILLARILENNTSLLDIRLDANCIEDEGAQALSRALAASSVSHIDLSGNCFGDEAAIALVRVLQDSPTLVRLELAHRALGPKFLEAAHKPRDRDNPFASDRLVLDALEFSRIVDPFDQT